MQTVITIAKYDLLRRLKYRETFLLGLLMPALMILLLGVAMSGPQEGTITIDVIDEDGSDLSAQFVALLADEIQGDEAFRLCAYSADSLDADCNLDSDLAQRPQEWSATADDRLEATDTYGVVIVPEGFGAALRAGETVTVAFKNNAELSAPTLAEQKINAAVSRMSGSVAIANLVVDVVQDGFDAFTVDARPAAFDAARAQIETLWNERPIHVEIEMTEDETSTLGFNQSGPGIAIMFILISMLNAATMLVTEREQGTLQRLYTLPHRRWVVLGGKLFGHYIYGLLNFAVLIIVGVIMGVEWGDNYLGIVLIMLTFTLATTALGMALATVVRTSAQASSISMLLGMTLSPLGGAWWPLEIVPDWMQTFGHISPVAWGMDAFGELMYYSGGVIDILPMLGALLLMAAVFFAFGVYNFKYE